MVAAEFHINKAEGDVGVMSGMSRSVPTSPGERERSKQGQYMGAGSARDLVGKVLRDQGLGRICDDDFIQTTREEMKEAMDLTDEQFDAAAQQLLDIEQLSVTSCPPSTPLALTPVAARPPPSSLTPVAAHRSPSSDISNGFSDTHL